MRYAALQKADVFMVGCEYVPAASQLTALLAWVKPERVQEIKGCSTVLVEPHRVNQTEILVVLPSDLEEMYTYLNLEVLSYESTLED